MNATTEIEATVVHAPGTDMAPYTAQAPEEYRARFVMEPAEAAALDEQLRNCMRAVLKPDVDYGLIPGMGTKPSLFKPGAEKLIQWFGFGFENNEVKTERDDPEYPSGIADKVRRVGVTYRCTVHKELADGRRVTIATCEAYAGYDEDKFYVSLEAARSKAEAKERQWAAKDKRQPNPSKWEYAAEYRAPWNSVIKMCEKRALVGAAIDATAAAGLFTQDLEDMRGGAAPDSGSLAEAATAVVMTLPDDVRAGLDRWYRGKRWPEPGQWTAEQWCAALQMAGYLTAKGEGGGGDGEGGQRGTDGDPQDGPATPPGGNGGGQVSRPARPQAAPETGDPDGEAQEYADHAHEARTITDLMDIQRRAREAGKIGAVINSPVTGKPGKLALYIDWKRKQIAEVDAALATLNDAVNAHGMSAADMEAHVTRVTGADIEAATAAQLRAAAKALERAA
jgi:hypothetical protein